MYIVMIGNAAERGHLFYGPFDDTTAAEDWAERWHGRDTWWVVPLRSAGVLHDLAPEPLGPPNPAHADLDDELLHAGETVRRMRGDQT